MWENRAKSRVVDFRDPSGCDSTPVQEVTTSSKDVNKLSEVCRMPYFSGPILTAYPGVAVTFRMTHPPAIPHMALKMV
jgi:hypothetical protein